MTLGGFVDIFDSYAALAAARREGVDFRRIILDRGAEHAVLAPHGGKIEPGTSLLSAAIAADRSNYYCLEGLLDGNNRELHVTSSRFDDPDCLALIAGCQQVVTIHGRADLYRFSGRLDGETIDLGGLDTGLREAIAGELSAAGFTAVLSSEFPALQPSNICNRGPTGRGVQIEVPRSLRQRARAEPALAQALAGAVRRGLDLDRERRIPA